MSLTIVDAEVSGSTGMGVRIEHGVICAMVRGLPPRPGDDVIDARGGALLPGLHDHHVHLRSLAAASASVWLGPPDVTGPSEAARRLRDAADAAKGGDWIRGIGYHESVAGRLDRQVLDQVV